MDIEVLKEKVKKAVGSYIRKKGSQLHDRVELETIAPGCLRKTSLAVDLLRTLTKHVESTVSTITRTFEKAEMHWSPILKHADYEIHNEVRLIKGKNTTLTPKCALSEQPLAAGSHWAIKIRSKKKADIAIGIISRRQAEKFAFCFRE